MKKLMHFGAIALFMAFASCSGDDSSESTNNNGGSTAEGTITAVVNGKNWTGTVKSATLLKAPEMGMQRFDISAEADGEMITLSAESEIANGMALGTYDFEEAGNALFINTYLVGKNTFIVHTPESGELNITAFDASAKKASGTFSFTATKIADIDGMDVPENYVVKNGVFTNVKYVAY